MISKKKLKEFIQSKEGFEWFCTLQEERELYSCHHLHLQSQKWRNIHEVDHIFWNHALTITIPKGIENTTVLMRVRGREENGKVSCPTRLEMQQLAVELGVIVVELNQVPFQPLTIHDEKDLYEDELVAASWSRFIATNDPLWVLQLPMLRSIVRAMDAVQAYAGDCGICVRDFVLTGRSKRAWSCWMTAALDARVKGIIPMVCDLLQIRQVLEHHREVYGEWLPALGPYVKRGFTDLHDDPRFEDLEAMVDPMNYAKNLKIEKLIMNASGDEFFPPDSSRHYYEKLMFPKALSILPNTNHPLVHCDVLENLKVFMHLMLQKESLPRIDWHLEASTNILRVSWDLVPSELFLYTAYNPVKKDFRMGYQGEKWRASRIELDQEKSIQLKLPKKIKGYSASFLQCRFLFEGVGTLSLSTACFIGA